MRYIGDGVASRYPSWFLNGVILSHTAKESDFGGESKNPFQPVSKEPEAQRINIQGVETAH